MAEPVDEEAGQGLHDAGDDEEDRHQQAEFGVAHAERVLEPREQRGQQELAEMADAVRQADQPDQRGVLAHGVSGSGKAGHDGLGQAAAMVAAPEGPTPSPISSVGAVRTKGFFHAKRSAPIGKAPGDA